MSASPSHNVELQTSGEPLLIHDRGSEPPRRLSNWRIIVYAIGFGLVISLIGIGLDAVLVTQHDSARVVVEASDGFTGLIAGLLFFRILLAQRTRQRRVLERLRAISALNDQIRNSLQIISLTAHALPEQQALHVIDNAVGRIENSLREVTPRI